MQFRKNYLCFFMIKLPGIMNSNISMTYLIQHKVLAASAIFHWRVRLWIANFCEVQVYAVFITTTHQRSFKININWNFSLKPVDSRKIFRLAEHCVVLQVKLKNRAIRWWMINRLNKTPSHLHWISHFFDIENFIFYAAIICSISFTLHYTNVH